MNTLTALLRDRAALDVRGPSYAWVDDRLRETDTLTLVELDRRARAIAAALEQPLRGERALLLFPAGLEFIAAFFGCMYAGLIAVPAYALGSRRDQQRIGAIFHDARPAVALTTAAHLAATRAALAATSPDPVRVIATDTIDVACASAWKAEGGDHAGGLAYLQYTSGSTTTPRGVMIGHDNILANLAYVAASGGFAADTRAVSWLPHFHDMGLVYGILQPLYSSFPVTLMSPRAFVQDPRLWLDAISRFRGTHCGGPNFAYDLCAERADDALRARLDLRSWRVAFNGAEPVAASTIARFSRCFAPCGFDARAFYPVYGLAEATLKVTSPSPGSGATVRAVAQAALTRHRIEPAAACADAHQLVGCGTTSGDTRVAIVEPATGAETASIGEIWIAGPGVASGYWQRAEETRETFGARLANGDGPFLRSGDLGFVADGQLFITGRLKDCIIIRGKNHYPHDIERSVIACHPALRSGAAAFSIRVDDQERLVVVAERRPSDDTPNDEIVRAIRRAVSAGHHVRAHAVALIEPGGLPRTTSGKLQRQACRVAFLTGRLPVAYSVVSGSRAPSRRGAAVAAAAIRRKPAASRAAAIHTYLLRVVADVLQTDSRLLDASAPLASYGLDSLMAVDVIHRVQTDLGFELSLDSILVDATLGELAGVITAAIAASATAPATVEAADASPLSYGQAGLWVIHRATPQSSAYNLARAIALPAGIDATALRRALDAVFARHDALRTRIAAVAGEPIQIVDPAAPAPFEIVDASAWTAEERQRRIEIEANRPCDLARGPACRVRYYSGPSPVLLLITHHALCDFWSFGVVLRDLAALYLAETTGTPAELGPPPASPASFARWERRTLRANEARLRDYWTQTLAGAPFGVNPLTGPGDAPRTSVARRGTPFRIDGHTASRLRSFAASTGTTPHAVLTAAFVALLTRYSGHTDLLLSVPSHRRVRREFRTLVGYLVNTLIVRADASGDPPFAALVARVSRTLADGMRHGALPFPLLTRIIDAPRDTAGASPTRVSFVFQQAPSRELMPWMPLLCETPGVRVTVGALEAEALMVPRSSTQTDLTLTISEIDDALIGWFEYDAGLFEPDVAARWAAHFRTLLASALATPGMPISELPMLTVTERRTHLSDWNDTAREMPAPLLIHALVEQQARRTPDAIAVAMHGAALSYATLDALATRVARQLRDAQAGPERVVALCIERSLELVIGMLGILKSGAAYMPLDPTHPDARLQAQLAQASPAAILASPHHLARVAGWTGPRFDLEAIVSPRGAAVPLAPPSSSSSPDHQEQVDDDGLAYVIYTSGSTGAPKGAMNTHRGLCNRVLWLQRHHPLGEGDRVLHKTPLTFDVSLGEIFAALIAGATLVIARPDGHRDVAYIRQLVARERVTMLHFVPSVLRAFLDDDGMRECESLRLMVCSGEALTLDLQTRVFAQPHVTLVNLYGPTEASVDVLAWTCARAQTSGPVPIGRPFDNVQAYVLDRHLEPSPVDGAGDLFIGGLSIGRGYLGRADLTAASFVPNPFGVPPGSRLYRTGDVACHRADGTIRYLGRVDGQVKLRGVRIELSEIEGLIAQHPSVRDCAVWLSGAGTGEAALACCVVARDEATWDVRALLEFLVARLPIEMVPARIARVPRLPLMSTGKIDRAALRGLDLTWERPERHATPPRTATEARIAAMCSELLDRDAADVHVNLFALGCHSLLATRLLARIRDEFQVEIPLALMFGGVATIAGLAEAADALRQASPDGAAALAQAPIA